MEEESPKEISLPPSPPPAEDLPDEVLQSSGRKRRKFNYSFVDEVAYGSEQLPRLPAERLVNAAARKWAKSAKEHVGQFSSPFLKPDDAWRVSCRCFRHTGCHAGEGKTFQFHGCMEGQIFKLVVFSDGKCRGPDRVCRTPQKQSLEQQLTPEQRRLVHEAADTLLETGRKVPRVQQAETLHPQLTINCFTVLKYLSARQLQLLCTSDFESSGWLWSAFAQS